MPVYPLGGFTGDRGSLSSTHLTWKLLLLKTCCSREVSKPLSQCSCSRIILYLDAKWYTKFRFVFIFFTFSETSDNAGPSGFEGPSPDPARLFSGSAISLGVMLHWVS